MNADQDPRLFILGGISGIIGTLCYVIAITVPLSQIGTYIFAMAWPLLSIIFVFSLNRFIALEKPSAANHLAFIFACLAFALVAIMISTQLAVNAGMQEYIGSASTSEREILPLVQRSIRLVDMGMDVAWDLFIGVALVFLSIALREHPLFRWWWAIPSVLLGLVLITLNALTFPWPPNTKGLIDIGPAVGLYIIALSARLTLLGNQMKSSKINGNSE